MTHNSTSLFIDRSTHIRSTLWIYTMLVYYCDAAKENLGQEKLLTTCAERAMQDNQEMHGGYQNLLQLQTLLNTCS